jgi:hypothetical protein
MTPDTRDDKYLWDRSGPVDPAVADLEARLAPLRFDPASRPLVLPRTRPRSWRAIVIAGTIAASLLVAVGFSYYEWRFEWATDRAWPVTVEPAAPGAASTSASLGVGESLQTIARASASRIDIARVGTIDAAAGTDLTVSSTGTRHRVRMERGIVDVRLWAPPGIFALHTPAGDVIDLGCVFQLAVEGETARLSVRTGWVQLANPYGESLVPAGASSVMRPDSRPVVPVYDDAPAAFTTAVRAFESGDTTGTALSSVVATARPRDVLTVLLLAARQSGPDRATLVARAAVLAPPPPTADLAAVSAGDNDALWHWIDDGLPLPPVKDWWRNWRDALPRLLAR